jgi:hypothetical protein
MAPSDPGNALLVSIRDRFAGALRARLARSGIVIGRSAATNRLAGSASELSLRWSGVRFPGDPPLFVLVYR